MTDKIALKFISYFKWKISEYEKKINIRYKVHLPQIYSDYLECYENGWKKAKCLFCLSTGRSGTMTLANILSSSREISSFHEPEPRLIHVALLAQQEISCLKNIPEPLLEKYKLICLAARDDYIFRANQKGKLYAEMNNYLTYLCPSLKAAFPNAKFIYIYRHPYDFIVSGINRKYYTKECRLVNYYGPNKSDPYFHKWENMSSLEKCAWLWARVNEDCINFCNLLKPDHIIKVKSEELFSSVDYSKTIFNFINIDLPESKKIEKVLGTKFNEQKDKKISSIKDLSIPELESIQEIVEPTAKKLGYSLSL